MYKLSYIDLNARFWRKIPSARDFVWVLLRRYIYGTWPFQRHFFDGTSSMHLWSVVAHPSERLTAKSRLRVDKACIRLALCISSSYDLLRHLSRNDVKISSIIKKHLRSRNLRWGKEERIRIPVMFCRRCIRNLHSSKYEDGWIAGKAVKAHFRNRQHYTNRTPLLS